MEELLKQYEEQGKRWMRGEENITSFNGIKLNEKQKEFVNSKTRYLLVCGGFACIEGKTRIFNADTGKHETVESLYDNSKGITVLSHSEGSIKKAQATIPVKYPKADLFRVKTDKHEFVATAKHRVLTKEGWKEISSLFVGERLLGFEPSQKSSILDNDPKVHLLDGFHLSHIVSGFQSYCRFLHYLCDALPQKVEDTFQGAFPSLACALAHIPLNYSRDGRLSLQGHNHSYLQLNPHSKIRSFLPKNTLVLNEAGCNEASISGRVSEKGHKWPKSLWMSFFHRIEGLVSPYSFPSSQANPTISEEIVQSISYEKTDHYYDIHVFGTNNYLAEGVFHHNSGKSLGFLIKLYLISMFFPNNRILLGRKTRQDVERALLPDLLEVFPEGTYEHKIGAGKIEFPNGSEIIFFGLDALQSGAGQDIKKAEQQIKSLNLGGFYIDQLEEIEFRVFEALTGRMRKDVPFQQACFTTNPANFWAYDYFKVNPRPNTKLIATSMLDNKVNLSPEFISDQLSKGELYKKRYVFGEWSPDTMVEGGVFSKETYDEQMLHVREPKRTMDGINIFVEPEEHIYQIGVDPSQGSVDPCGIKVVDTETGEMVASYKGYVPTQVQVEKTVQLALMYSLWNKPLVIPEVNAAGQAFVESLKLIYDNIYVREVFIERTKSKSKKLGWNTSHATKTQLIENMKSLFHSHFPKVKDRETVSEMPTFIYSDEASQKGAGAQRGYHDDQIMSTMLAYWGVKPKSTNEKYLEDLVFRSHARRDRRRNPAR